MFRRILTAGLKTATALSVTSTAAMMCAGLYETDSPWSPINSIYHMFDGDDTTQPSEFSLRQSAVGMAVNTSAMTVWGLLYEAILALSSCKSNPAAGCAAAATAFIVDYVVLPPRFSPGFEKKLSRQAIFRIYQFLPPRSPCRRFGTTMTIRRRLGPRRRPSFDRHCRWAIACAARLIQFYLAVCLFAMPIAVNAPLASADAGAGSVNPPIAPSTPSTPPGVAPLDMNDIFTVAPDPQSILDNFGAIAPMVSPSTPTPSSNTTVTPVTSTKPEANPDKNKTAASSIEPTGSFGSASADDENGVIIENADTAEQTSAGKWIAMGDVRVRYRGYVVTSDRVDIDTNNNEAVFSGHLIMRSPAGDLVEGGPNGSLRINLDTDTFVVSDSRTTVGTNRLGIGLIEPLYVYGGLISGRQDFVDAFDSSFTTCDFPSPHYHFEAREIYIVPGSHLVAKHVTLYRRKKALITIPYLVIPLDRRASTLSPQFGDDPNEGYFAKFAIGYLLASNLPGILHIDLMQKEGIGAGFDQSYGNPNNIKDGNGEVSAYELPDKALDSETLSGSFNHKQQFGTVLASINAQMQQDSYYLGDTSTKTFSNQMSFTRNVGDLNTSFVTNISNSDYGTGSSQTLTSSLDETFQPTSHEQLTTKFDYSDFSSGFAGTSSSSTGELNSNIEYDEQDRLFDWKFLANKYTLVQNTGTSGIGGFYGGLERLPEFDLSTDPKQEPFLRFLPKPATISLALGDYNEPSSGAQDERLSMGVDSGNNTIKIDSWQALDLDGSFVQRFYSDNAAQYILTDHTDYRLRIGEKSTASFRYDYLRPYGYTPFQFDFSGNTNLVSANLAYQETKSFQLEMSTGYDINEAEQQMFFGQSPIPWQTLSMQTLYTPNADFGWQQSGSFDINHGQLVDLTDNFRIRGHGGEALDLGSRYEPQLHRLADATGRLDVATWTDRHEDAGYKLQAIGGYDGITDQFDYSGIALTRSWHDWETSVIYETNPIGIQAGNTITFNIRLKAFPAYEPFAAGQFGQSLDTGLGTVY